MGFLSKITGGGGGGGGGGGVAKKAATVGDFAKKDPIFAKAMENVKGIAGVAKSPADAELEQSLAEKAFGGSALSEEDKAFQELLRGSVNQRMAEKRISPQEMEMQQEAVQNMAKQLGRQRLMDAERSMLQRGLKGAPGMIDTGAQDTAQQLLGIHMNPYDVEPSYQAQNLQKGLGYSGMDVGFEKANRGFEQGLMDLRQQKRMQELGTIGAFVGMGGKLAGNLASKGSSDEYGYSGKKNSGYDYSSSRGSSQGQQSQGGGYSSQKGYSGDQYGGDTAYGPNRGGY